MKFVSALILVCAFACASAQFGVKGGASGSSKGVRAGPFFPRLTPGSIQEKKEQLQLANVDDGGSSVVVVGGGGSGAVGPSVGSTNGGFVQPVGQQENVVQTFVQERPTTQQVLVPSSGSVSSLPSVGSVSVPVGQKTVSPFQQQTFSFVPSFQPVLPPPTFGNVAQFGQVVAGGQPAVGQVVQPAPVQTVQTVQPAVQSFQSFPSVFAPVTKSVQPSNRFFFDNRQPAPQFVQFGAAGGPVNPSFPNFAQNIVHFTPSAQPQVATVQTVPAFASNDFGSRAVKQVVKQFATPTVVAQPAPVQSFPGFSAFPQGFAPVPAVPQVPAGFAVPSVSSAGLPVSAFPTTSVVTPTVSGKIFTDNRISAPQGFTTFQQQQQQQQLPSVISQEKQSAETVQTTEW